MKYVTAILLFLATAGAAHADEQCRLSRVGSAPMTLGKDGVPSVPLSARGSTVQLVVDTASEESMVNWATVKALQLRALGASSGIRYSKGRMTFLGMMDAITKNQSHTHTIVPAAVLGGWQPIDISFFVVPNDVLTLPYGGVFASDLLAKFDTEFDFANGTLNLFSPIHCPGQVVYWTKEPAAKIPFEVDEYHEIEIPIELDGRAMKAIISTASPQTFASFERLGSDFDIGVRSAGLKATPAPDGKSDVYQYPFKALSFEGVTIQDPNIALVPSLTDRISHGPDEIVIGADLLRRFHLYISYNEKTIYLTSATAH